MAQVTMELRHVLMMKNFKLFDFEYPIVDIEWKRQLEQLIKDYYYFHEIGFETIDRFKHVLKAKLNLIMPYYNDLYLTTLLDIDPLLTIHIKETLDNEKVLTDNRSIDLTDEGSMNITGEVTNDEVMTEYPQSSNISNDIPTQRTGDVGTSTSDTLDNRQTTTRLTGDQVTDNNYLKIIEGFDGNIHENLRSYRKNIININNLIIQDLKTLFILVY